MPSTVVIARRILRKTYSQSAPADHILDSVHPPPPSMD